MSDSNPTDGRRTPSSTTEATGSVNGVGKRTDPGSFDEFIANAMSSRREWMRSFSDPRRDIYDECGYQREPVTWSVYQDLYDREGVASRVVEVMPKECWQVQPQVYEAEEYDVTTPFEEAWYGLGRTLRGEKSWYQDERGSVIWEHLRRADILSGIGYYGILLLGLDDGDTSGQVNLHTPAVPRKGQKLVYLRCLPESLSLATRFETDGNSPRFGQPTEYLVTFNDPRNVSQGAIGLTTATQSVHWTRVVHLCDNSHQADGSEVFAPPRMRPVLNRLLDLQKLYSGSAEMYWRGAFPGLSFETHPNLGGDVEFDRAALRNDMENYMNGLQRYLALQGMTAKSLGVQVVDPTPQIQRQIEAICIKIACPKRVFMGSERGELASSQDDSAWNDRLKERQHGYLTPRVIVPLIDRLIWLGVLPEPDGYSVYWPDLTSQSNSEKADIALKRTQGLGQYAASGARTILLPFDYLRHIQGFTEEEAANAVAAAEAVYGPEGVASPELAAGQPPPGDPSAQGSFTLPQPGNNRPKGKPVAKAGGKKRGKPGAGDHVRTGPESIEPFVAPHARVAPVG